MYTLNLPFLNTITLPSLDRLKNIQLNDKHRKTIVGITAATALVYSAYRMLSIPDPFKNKKGLKEIPIPDGCYPYIGHLLAIGSDTMKATMDWHRRYGPLIHIRMGVLHWLLVDDPYLAHKIFVTNGSVTNDRPSDFSLLEQYSDGGRGIISAPYSHKWKKGRTAALSILAPKKLEVFLDVIVNESDALVNRLILLSEKDGAVSPMAQLELCTLNFISLALFGNRFDSVNDPGYFEVANIPISTAKLLALDKDIGSILPITSFLSIFSNYGLKMKNFVKNVRTPTMRQLLKEAEAREGPNLVKSMREGEFQLDAEDELVFFADLLNGGTDTTATTLNWAVAILCNHPESQSKIYEELERFVVKNGRLPKYEERSETPYTVCVMKESLRFRPIFTFNVPHRTMKEIEVDGYIIPANITISVAMDSMNRNPNIYDRPEEFIPERFINNKKSMMASANGNIEERDQYNFGWGRRICPGIYLAELVIYSAVTKMIYRSIIEPVNGLPDLEKQNSSSVVSLPKPYQVKFTKRV
ncbi:cytochrome P450 [Pilobolus umbonatus]|nr:cytochrome P450 [Pilobolus umbonatus]